MNFIAVVNATMTITMTMTTETTTSTTWDNRDHAHHHNNHTKESCGVPQHSDLTAACMQSLTFDMWAALKSVRARAHLEIPAQFLFCSPLHTPEQTCSTAST
eukprot:3615504-Rhodomonas_salina.1